MLLFSLPALTRCAIGYDSSKVDLIKDCREILIGRLKDPFSYKAIKEFDLIYDDPMEQAETWSDSYQASYPNDYKYIIPPHDTYVNLEYTAKNGFGGSVRNDFSCFFLGTTPVRVDGDDLYEVNDDLSLSVPR